MGILQIGVMGIVGVLFAVQLKQEKAELAIYLCIGISILIFFQILTHMGTLVSAVKELSGQIQMDVSYMNTLLKMLGITYVAEFVSGICKDAGYQAIAAQIEIFGKVVILVLSMPILMALLKTIQEYWI